MRRIPPPRWKIVVLPIGIVIALSVVPWLIFRMWTFQIADDVNTSMAAKFRQRMEAAQSLEYDVDETGVGDMSVGPVGLINDPVDQLPDRALGIYPDHIGPPQVDIPSRALEFGSMVNALDRADMGGFHPEEIIPLVNIPLGISRNLNLRAAADRVIAGTADDDDRAFVAGAVASSRQLGESDNSFAEFLGWIAGSIAFFAGIGLAIAVTRFIAWLAPGLRDRVDDNPITAPSRHPTTSTLAPENATSVRKGRGEYAHPSSTDLTQVKQRGRNWKQRLSLPERRRPPTARGRWIGQAWMPLDSDGQSQTPDHDA